jgi:large subunit ribosomal protein L13
MKTFSAKAQEVDRKWFVIDAKDQVLGKVAERAARVLRGKDKAIFTPHVDTGDFVVVINTDKEYRSFSGYVGGHHTRTPKMLRQTHPELLVEKAVKGMIPHNRLGRAVYRKLKVYKGEKHPHEAQAPQPLAL